MFEFINRLFGPRSDQAGNGPPLLRSAVAARQRAETGLRDSEEQFAKLVSGVRDYAVFLLDLQGNILTWNAGAEQIKGYRPEEIIGRNFSQFYTAESLSSGWPTHELKMATATGRFEDEGWRVRKDGTRFWASVVITALRDDDGGLRGFLKITRDLTDRKQAEEKLRLSEERFRLLVEGVRDHAIFMLDPQGKVATWNEGAARLKGYQAGEILGRHFSCFYPPEALAAGWPAEELRRAAAEGQIEDEGPRVRKDGSTFWAGVVITALRDDTGALRGFAKLTRDLTSQREADENTRRLLQEEAARHAAEESAQIIERQREQLYVTLASIGDAVVVTDQHGAITFLNAVAEQLTGWELRQAAGKQLDDVFRIVNEQTGRQVESPVSTVFRENRVVELANHTVLVSRGGRRIPIEDSAAPIRNRDGTVGGAVLVFRDVTEARRASEARLYLASIVESSDDAIIGQTLDGRIASWNRGAQRLYGYEAEEIVGKPLTLLVPTDHPDELPLITERIRRGEAIEHFETERICKDGTRIDVSLTISPVKNAEGTVIGASKIARDITARKEEDRRKSEFLALLAHELRNPLAPLRNGLQVMRLAENDREALERARGAMERQLHHLVRLVDDLLDVSRISRGKLQLHKERMPLAAVIEHGLELCGEAVRNQGHELIVELPESQIFVDADKTRLAQALCNLLNNAAKYSEAGTPIRLAVERQGAEAVITVADRGVGISPEMLPKVFEMFMQIDRTLEKSQGGLGVGLTIVKRLVEMHDGTIEARSEGSGQGSEFIIRLPVVLSVVREPAGPVRESAGRKAFGRRILVVDDNVDAASTLSVMLEMMGNEVRTCHDGKAGLEAAEQMRPDLMLLDIGMPKLNGYEVAQSIRARPWAKSVTLVALTGWGQEDDRRKSEEAGFDYHMVKPVEPATLEQLIAAIPSSTA